MAAMEKSLGYKDVYLIPRYSELRSRSEADISVEFLGRKFKAPWLPANMESVIDEKTAHWLSENDYFYIMHRFGDTKIFVQNAVKNNWKTVSISIGVKPEDYQLVKDLDNWWDCDIDYVTVDVAHAHSILVKDMLSFLKKRGSNGLGPKIIAGNVATPEAVKDLEHWGADAVKIGLSMGKSCTTYNSTGVGSPMFSTSINCNNLTKVPIISDGQIREFGDISKALFAGSSFVMIGSLLSCCLDSPAKTIVKYRKTGFCDENGNDEIESIKLKHFYGSASKTNKGNDSYIEGRDILLESNNLTIKEWYRKAEEALQSSISYSGGRKVKDLTNFRYTLSSK